MRYWVYINDKVVGPYEEDKLAELEGFTPETLICTETVEAGASQQWVKASSVFDFDDSARTITRGTLTPQEVANAAPLNDVASHSDLTAQLLAKIDQLTQEIEGMKGKLDEAVAANNAAQEATAQQIQALSASIKNPSPAEKTLTEDISLSEENLTKDAAVTNTTSLTNHAEQVVSGAQATDKKPVDFLDEIQIGNGKDNATEKIQGEEVVLRSALDSLYNSNPKEQTEKEKEDTFQDLLSPFKTAATAAAAGVAVTAAASALSDSSKEKTAEEKKEDIPADQPSSDALSEEQREDLINEITQPAAQEDFISQAIAEAEQQSASDVPSLEQAPAEEQSTTKEEPSVAVSEQKTENEPILEMPGLANGQDIQMEEMAADKEPLDLSNQPQLNIQNTPQEDISVPTSDNNNQLESVDPNQVPLTPMNPEQLDQEQDEKEKTETARELVPGKKLEPERNDGLISQKDLDEAFSERETIAAKNNLDLPENLTQTTNLTQSLPEGQGFYNPKEMTEVQLKEGSTYLISDFIPPAETGNKTTRLEDPFLEPQPAIEEPQLKEETDAIEEIVPQINRPNNAHKEEANATEELTMSKVVLENTIKTKRGATMDIKTVPMVKEPGNSERLNLTDADLDLSAQHDLKSADDTRGSNNLTKIIFFGLIFIVAIIAFYFMSAYLGFLPEKYDIFKPTITADTAIDDELLSSSEPVASQQQPPVQTTNANPLDNVLNEVKNYTLINGQTLQQLINSRHPSSQDLIEWNINTAVDPDNYSILVKVPPENAQSFKISYRFNYNVLTKVLDPTISDSKNLLDSVNSRR